MQFCCIVLSSFHGFIAVLWHQNCYNTCKISSCRVCSLFITPANRGSPQTETSWIHAMYVHTVAVPIHCRGVSGLWIDKVLDKTCNNYLISRSFRPYHFYTNKSELQIIIIDTRVDLLRNWNFSQKPSRSVQPFSNSSVQQTNTILCCSLKE